MFSLNGAAPCPTSCHSTQHDSTQLMPTPRMVAVCAPARPIQRPANPASIAPASGASTMASNTDLESVNSMPGIGSTLHHVDFGDVDRAPVAEKRDHDRQADGGLCSGDGQDEEHEHLARRITELPRERHEVDVHRQQHQLDAHQQHDDVLAVDEDAGNGDAEQHRGQREVMSERDHCLPSWPPSAGILTRRMRSSRRTAACRAGSWCLVPGRRRRVSITATTSATVRITAAVSNGRMYWLNRVSPSHWMLVLPTAAAGSLPDRPASKRLPLSSMIISAAITTATTSASGTCRMKPSRSGTTLMSSIITTNRNSTITAPT